MQTHHIPTTVTTAVLLILLSLWLLPVSEGRISPGVSSRRDSRLLATPRICDTLTPCTCVSHDDGFLIDLSHHVSFPKRACYNESTGRTICYIWQPCNSIACGDESSDTALCKQLLPSASSPVSEFHNLGNMEDARFKRDNERKMIYIQYVNPNNSLFNNRVYLVCPSDFANLTTTTGNRSYPRVDDFRLYEIGNETDGYYIDFIFISPYACFMRSEGSFSHWQNITLLILGCSLILVASYCLIGVAANYFIAKRRNLSLLPHYHFWMSVCCCCCCCCAAAAGRRFSLSSSSSSSSRSSASSYSEGASARTSSRSSVSINRHETTTTSIHLSQKYDVNNADTHGDDKSTTHKL